MIIEACLFINPEDCTQLHWINNESVDSIDEFEEYSKKWIYIGLFDIEAGKINEAFMSEKHWKRKVVRNE